MVNYKENELLSVTSLTKQFSSVLKGIKDHTIEKIGVLKNNKLEAVVISTQEYRRLKELEALWEAREHKQIYESMQQRKDTDKKEFVDLDTMAEKFDIKLQDI